VVTIRPSIIVESMRKVQSRWLCFWRKSNQLQIIVRQTERVKSEMQQAEKAIEVSHGSAGDFSRSTASQTYLKRKCVTTVLCFCLILILLTVGVLVPLFWYGSIPEISQYMKKAEKYRLPFTIIIEALLFLLIGLCIVLLVKKGRSLQRRVSYVSSYSSGRFTSSIDRTATSSSLRSTRGGARLSHATSSSSMHVVALRQILEELPEDCIERVQELAKLFLSSGDGRSSIVPGKFSFSQQVSIDSNSVHTYRVATKVLLLGDVNVGKTSIFHRLLYDQFSPSYLQTIGADLGFSTLSLSSKLESDQLAVGLQIWDIGGQEQLARATKLYYKDAVIIIPVADISNVESLHALQYWLRDVVNKIYDPYVVLLLNKADLENKEVTEDDINEIAELKDVERYEVSAKTGANVSRAFTETIAKVLIKETAKILDC